MFTADNLARVFAVEGQLNAMEREMALYRPLMEAVLPMTHWLSVHAVPRSEWFVSLCRDEWRDQCKAGIDRVLGCDIHWI